MPNTLPRVGVAIVGTGFVAELHMHAYRRVYGVMADVVAACSRGDGAAAFASRHGIPATTPDWRTLLDDPAIDVIDLCTPPATHTEMVVACMQAGKHVICEKPFTGYFGQAGDPAPIGTAVPKATMFARVLEEMDRTAAAIRATGKLFMYAEDWVYAPAVRKCAEMLRATRDKVLFIKAEESHSGSHAEHAARWDQTGGGALIRQGCHPLSAALHLKQVEAHARGEQIAVASVTCDTGLITPRVPQADRRYLNAHPVDVEDWGTMTLTFTDGTKATVLAGDMILGGVRNLIEVYTSGGVLHANIAPNNHMVSYATDEEKLAGVYITEKVDRKTGWQQVCLEEEWTRGYQGEIQDFMECAATGRQPLAGLELAYESIRIHYAAYQAAEEGRRIDLGGRTSMSRIIGRRGVLAVGLGIAATAARAQGASWKPTRPINLIVPWAAGGSTDQVTRVVASELEGPLGQSIVIINQPGASGAIGTRSALDAARDGYTWTSGAVQDLGAYETLGSVKTRLADWNIYLSVANAAVLAVGAKQPFQTAAELLDAMKAKPGSITVATAGVTSAGHAAMDMIANAAHLTYRNVNYDGGNPAVIATVAGETIATSQVASDEAEMIRGKMLRPLAAIGNKPVELEGFGAIAPLSDALPGFSLPANYFGIFLPTGVPADVVATLDRIWADTIATSAKLKAYAARNGALFDPLSGEKAQQAAFPAVQANAWQLFNSGKAKVSPATVGIPAPPAL